ncbi:phosphoribosyltransferase [Megamonas hypermegale]|uniref:phosphoribosyltransferase n=1 Tax=Megamonas hypermegale TaxID=158847 RepID=UPI0026F08A52|nr:phosphoribosyltransferase [Megamonas hypermegale]
MNYVELSIKSLDQISKTLANKIKQSYNPSLIIYIAKGGFLIAKSMSEILDVPIIGIYAVRKGNKNKERLAPILSKIPKCITKILRIIELKSGLHKTIKERHVYFDKDIENFNTNSLKILIVDDSIDTGYSMLAVKNMLINKFKNIKDIKVAAINVWDKSDEIITVDFYCYKNTIMVTPMSKDSKEYGAFIKLYEQENKRQVIGRIK